MCVVVTVFVSAYVCVVCDVFEGMCGLFLCLPACPVCAVAFVILLLERHALEVLCGLSVVFLILWNTRTCATLETSYSECPTLNVLQ